MKNIGTICFLVAFVMLFRPDLVSIKPQPQPSPTPNMYNVEPIRRLAIDSDDAAKIKAFYRDFADVIERDENGVITSSEVFITANSRAGRLMFQGTNIQGKYPDLAREIDAVIADSLGSKRTSDGYEPVTIDNYNRKRLAEALRAVSWAVER